MNPERSIEEMLTELAESPQMVENFNENPRVFMTAFGLSNRDRQTVLAYIALNTWRPEEFLNSYGISGDHRTALLMLIIC